MFFGSRVRVVLYALYVYTVQTNLFMNKDWHAKNPFPQDGSEAEKETWRETHKTNCDCGRMLLPYRRTTREK